MGLTAILVLGCKGQSPFLAMQFATTIQNIPGRGPTGGAPSTQPGGSGSTIDSVTDLPPEQRGISISVRNESQQSVQFAMTLVVSAGAGGFVPDSEIQNYINAGYTDLIPPGGGNTATIGCDTITLLSGTRLLGLEYGIDQGAIATLSPNPGGDPANPNLPTFQLTRRDNNSVFLPLPELIVFGNEDPKFICSGTNLCTQNGFVYVSATGIPIGKPAAASRIQGTVCNEGFGTSPEWVLDRTPFDSTISPFQFAPGGTIVATVLDRSSDAPTTNRNQVVWQVTNAAGQVVIFPKR